jgi:hypothetical protein
MTFPSVYKSLNYMQPVIVTQFVETPRIFREETAVKHV